MSDLVKASECAIFTQRRGHSLLMHLKCVSNSEHGFCFPHFAFSFKLYVCQLLVTPILLSTFFLNTNVFMLCGVGLYPSCMLWCWFLCFLEFGDYVFELWVNILVPHSTHPSSGLFANSPNYLDKKYICLCLHSGDTATSSMPGSSSCQTPYTIEVILKHYQLYQRHRFVGNKFLSLDQLLRLHHSIIEFYLQYLKGE